MAQPAAQSKLRELRQRARSACFVPLLSTKFSGQTVSKSTSVHEIVGSGGQDIKQPEFYVEPNNPELSKGGK